MVRTRQHPPFVGRSAEIERLLTRLAAAGEGNGDVVLIAGEPGIGKTRLLEEFAECARGAGWRALIGRAHESEGAVPYLPFSDAFRDYLRDAEPGHSTAAFGSGAAAIARLVPDAGEGSSARTVEAPSGSDVERYRLFEAIAGALLTLARAPDSAGLVMLIDDLQWADRTSLLLFGHLARRLRGARLLLVGAHRTAGFERGHPLAELLAGLSREGATERIALAPLARQQAATMIAGLLGTAPPEMVVAAIERQAAGNPLFLRELTRHLAAEGRDLTDPRAAVGEWRIPESLRQVIGRRLVRLSAEANALLRAAAVLGAHIRFELLEQICDLTDTALMDAVEEAVDAGMAREEAGAYEFSHPLIRQAVYEELSLPRRRRLHLRAGQALERLHAGRAEPYLAEIASHYQRAGPAADPSTTIDYSLRAGEAARAVFAYEEAAVHWRAALELMEGRGDDADALAGLLERLGDVYVTGLDAAAGIHFHERALEFNERLGRRDAAARLHLRLAADLAPLPEMMGTHPAPDIDRALAHYRAAELIMAGEPESPALGRLYAGMGATDLSAARIADALVSSRRALALAERFEDEALWAAAAFVHGCALADTGAVAAGLALWQRAWDTADRLDDPATAFVAACCRGAQAVYLRDPRDAQAWFRRELATPRVARAPLQRRALLRQLAQAHAYAGELAEAHRLLAEEGEDAFIGPLLAFWRGDWEGARTAWAAGRARARRAGNRWLLWINDHHIARLHEVREECDAAEPFLREAIAIGVAGGDLLVELVVRPQAAILHARSGRPDVARSHVARCQQILAGGEDWRGLAGRVALAEAVLAEADGDRDGAERAFERAIATFRRYALPWDEAEALERWAAGRRTGAGELLDRATALYRRHGAGRPWLDRVDAARSRIERGPGGVRSLPARPAGLSERELQVLRLLAQGRSNPEIARALVISLYTVNRHVNHIFAKLGVENRVEAATYAQRHGLT